MYLGNEGFIIDIPYYEYEVGSGYNWKKIPDVKFDASSIIIEPTRTNDARQALEEPW